MLQVLVTGAAGFIGFHVAQRLLGDQHHVVGVDSFNQYYSPQLKEDRLARLSNHARFVSVRFDLASRQSVRELFNDYSFDIVIHLAAQAGVRYSLEHPEAYVDSNLVAFGNVLEGCRHSGVKELVYASSSSVYGANEDYPFAVADRADRPINLYAATKRANELMAYSYSTAYGLPTTGLRFFTVYGPWGRPDMALFKFTKAIIEDKPIELYNGGDMRRDFTYIDDAVEMLIRLVDRLRTESVDEVDYTDGQVPFRLFNVASGNPRSLMDMIYSLEAHLGKKAQTELLPMQLGDMLETSADIGSTVAKTDYRPATELHEGIGHFVDWYLSYYKT